MRYYNEALLLYVNKSVGQSVGQSVLDMSIVRASQWTDTIETWQLKQEYEEEEIKHQRQIAQLIKTAPVYVPLKIKIEHEYVIGVLLSPSHHSSRHPAIRKGIIAKLDVIATDINLPVLLNLYWIESLEIFDLKNLPLYVSAPTLYPLFDILLKGNHFLKTGVHYGEE